MKTQIMLISLCLLFTGQLIAQLDFTINNEHVSFDYDNPASIVGFDEFSHWTSGSLQFWLDDQYDTGTTMGLQNFVIYDPNNAVNFGLQELRFFDMFSNRVVLDYNGLQFFNGASWQFANLFLRGNEGQLQLDSGTGLRTAYLGTTGMNSMNGDFLLYNQGVLGARVSGSGIARIYGTQSENIYMGPVGGRPNDGYLAVLDDQSVIRAGAIVNAMGQGEVFGDVLNVIISSPDKNNKQIVYSTVQGPESAVYERGTAKLVNGEVFVDFSDHYVIAGVHKTMTVQLTPHEWDTYGLAVIEKSDDGFYVKELKGGTGNFSFDWEVKCVKSGQETFEVVRSLEYMKQMPQVEDTHPAAGSLDSKSPETSKVDFGGFIQEMKNLDCKKHK